MRLLSLTIDRLPGIDESFALEGLSAGFHVIVGPNGIGKSSLCRATRALLWREHGPQGQEDYMAASALFDRDGESWHVERHGSHYRWQRNGLDAAAPALPVAHLERCFFLVLRDLLDATAAAGTDLAAEIRRQMSGGFDLDMAARTLFGSIGPRHGSKERRDLDETNIDVRKAISRQAQTAREVDRLAALERDAAAAEEARLRLVHFAAALDVQRLRADLHRIDANLSVLPEALGRLTGGEMAQLELREAELEGKREQRRAVESELEDATGEATATRLESPLDPVLLSTWRERTVTLADLEARLGSAREECKAREQAAAEASRAAGGPKHVIPAIDVGAAADLYVFLRQMTSTDNEMNVVCQRLDLLGERLFVDADHRRLELLRDGVGPLRSWLRTPDPEAAAGVATSGRRKAALAAALALVAAGAVLALALHPAFALLAAAGLGLAAATWLLRPDPGAGYARETARREFPAGLEPPASWTRATVTERLRRLEGELADLEAAAQRARDRAVERASLEHERAVVEKRRDDLGVRRRELASRLGLAAIPEDAHLVDMARSLDRLRQAREAKAAADGREREIEERYGKLLAGVAAELRVHGKVDITDAAAARARIERLREDDHALRAARDRAEHARRSLRQIDADVARVSEIVAGIYQHAGLEPGNSLGLAQLLKQLDLYHDLCAQRAGPAHSLRIAEERLTRAGERDLADADPERLAAEQRHLDERSGVLDDLRRQIADIRAEARRASGGYEMEDAIARRDTALGRLEERREEALRAGAGMFLLDTVLREHETSQMPRVLERARELFGTFTHHAYDLRVMPGDTGSFVAVEAHSGAGRSPQELSDGTRAQLLLAARLAFAEEAEHGLRMPLFLDEALDQSDPARFRAIARSLGRMVADTGRQIFYLTSDPADVPRLQQALDAEGCDPARVIDLATVRRRSTSITGPEALRVDPVPPIPSPSGKTPEDYGSALGVPPLHPRLGYRAQHLIYLLWEDLPLLHRLLENRIERVGQWLTLSASGGDMARRIAAVAGAGEQLDARAELLDTFCHAWSEGRGKPVGRDAIERSAAVSSRYLEAVVEVAGELACDARRLLAVLRSRNDERLQGFRGKATEALETFLLDEGYLDTRPVLAEEEILVRLLATPAAARLPEPLAAESVRRWWTLCQRAAGVLPSQRESQTASIIY